MESLGVSGPVELDWCSVGRSVAVASLLDENVSVVFFIGYQSSLFRYLGTVTGNVARSELTEAVTGQLVVQDWNRCARSCSLGTSYGDGGQGGEN